MEAWPRLHQIIQSIKSFESAPPSKGGRAQQTSKYVAVAQALHPGQYVDGLTAAEARGIWKACRALKQHVVIRTLSKDNYSVWRMPNGEEK